MKFRYFVQDFGPFVAVGAALFCALSCAQTQPAAPTIVTPTAIASTTVAPTVAPTIAPIPVATPTAFRAPVAPAAAQSATVDLNKLRPAQGRLAPGVLVYNQFGDVEGRVIRVAPEYVYPNGVKGAVEFNYDDDSRDQGGHYVPFKMFDMWFVLEN